MNSSHNAARTALLCAALCLCSGCASQQLLALKDRDLRDLRQQVASRQEALVKALRTLESVRAELNAAGYERRELEQEVARSSAAIQHQQQTIDRLEAQKAELQEKLRQSEIAYERLRQGYQDLKSVLSDTVSELAQTRRDPVVSSDGLAGTEPGEHTRLQRKVDELRSQILRERAERRAMELGRGQSTPAPPREENPRWVWRLTEEPPEVETMEPGTLVADETEEPKAADSTADEPHVVGTAFLWTLGAIPAIGITLLMFIVLVRVMSRPDVGAREVRRQSPPAGEDEDEIVEPEDETVEYDAAEEHEDFERDGDEVVTTGGDEPDVGESTDESEPRPAGVRAAAPSGPTEPSPAETAFIDSLDWLEETAQPPRRRRKYTQDTEALQVPDTSGLERPRDAEPSAKTSRDRDHRAASRASALEPRRKPWRDAPRESADGNSDTQMIEKFEEDEVNLTQVLPSLGREVCEDADTDQTFTETAVLDAGDVGGARRESADSSQDPEEIATDTQVLPPLLDFEDDSELDEALAATGERDEANASLERELETDDELLAELEDLMGEKFEEPAL